MAWTQVSEQSHLNTSDRAAGGERTAKRHFIAISDTATEPWEAETASDGVTTIPLINSLLEVGDTRRAKSINAKPDPEAPRTVFYVEVEYSSKGNDSAEEEDPLDRDPEISWDFSDFTETYAEDRTPALDGGPFLVMNTAAQMFEEFLERDTGTIRCSISRNIIAEGYDPAVAVAYKDAVNTDAFDLDGVTIGIGECKMRSYTAGPRLTENGVAYRVAKWELEFKPSWDHDVESRGYQELTTDTPPSWADIKGADGKKVDSPWPLDVNGAALSDPTGAPEVLTFVPYFQEAFTGWETIWAYAP